LIDALQQVTCCHPVTDTASLVPSSAWQHRNTSNSIEY